ncbi:hypothetical protein SLEP1_g59355 [Rubroshorea leprosula]|uniref:Uncharacterized protein n=1 Tax=Rubroshorea leprosula TaxID=152421 RepID=A0AAV5MT88_9ROSI|nr:hypothetical protein SLEP1_g59355 [Rubroshorea leprosula]
MTEDRPETWNNVSGPERIDVKMYIEFLAAEIEELNRQLALDSRLKFFCFPECPSLTMVGTSGKRLLAVSDPSQMKISVTETSASELAKLLYRLMVAGYSIRNIEVQFDMERVLGTPPKLAELPPGENI